MIVDLLLSALFLFVVPLRLLVLLLKLVLEHKAPFSSVYFTSRVTQDLIIPLPCLTLVFTEAPLFFYHFYVKIHTLVF